jgi:hypothetical protein
MLAEMWLVNRLIIDAGIGLHDADLLQQPDQVVLLVHHCLALQQAFGGGKVDTAGVGRYGDAKAGLLVSQTAKQLESGLAHHLDVPTARCLCGSGIGAPWTWS